MSNNNRLLGRLKMARFIVDSHNSPWLTVEKPLIFSPLKTRTKEESAMRIERAEAKRKRRLERNIRNNARQLEGYYR